MNADALLHWLLRTSLEASVLILAVLGLRLMLGARLSPAWRIGLWLLVGAKLMLPAFIPAGFGLGGWMQNENTAAIIQAVAFEPSVYSEPSVGQSDPVPASQHFPFDIRHYALALWLTGFFIVLTSAMLRQRRFNSLLLRRPRATAPLLRALIASLSHKAGIEKPVRIILMPAGATPAVVGIVQPGILLPEDWESRFDESSLRHVLLHELLHVKQHDLIWNWAAIAVQALHWFNPLVWFVVSRFQADRELRCDAGALALLSPTERLDYGHTLLRIQETFFAPPALAGLAPCVRNHPTLRQRIHMIAHPAARQPALQLLLVLTLSVLAGYSFTTARAVEKEVPAKERTREGARTPARPNAPYPNRIVAVVDGEPIASSEVRKAMQDEGGVHNEQEMLEIMIKNRIAKIQNSDPSKQPSVTRNNDSGKNEANTPTRSREGDGGTKKPGMRDGDGGTRKPGTGDGEAPRKPGMRDGEKPRTGMRDGEGGKKTGARDGDKTASSVETITLRVIKSGDAVMVGEEEVSMNRLRGHLSEFLPAHPGAKIVVTSDTNVPFSALHNTIDAVRDNGNKNVGIKAE
jgi:beta-lactamase regulating signal transducer with metallopeptidase domain